MQTRFIGELFSGKRKGLVKVWMGGMKGIASGQSKVRAAKGQGSKHRGGKGWGGKRMLGQRPGGLS